MKSLGYIFILLFFCSLPVFSQKNFSMSGTLIDKSNNNEPLDAASVELLMQKDSAYVSGGITDKNGIFIFKNLAPNSYILKATFVGYLTVFKNVKLTGDKPSTNLGQIEMTSNAVLLKEAVVEGKKPEIVVKNDTIEYDAASYKTTENAVVEDLLKKLPGVEVDKEGKITVNGKEVKKFKVDGKDFFSDDPQVTSKNLPAEMVDKLQVIDEKSEMARMTGFDDGEETTIINLTIRPGMKKGTMGNALAGIGSDINIDKATRYQGAAFLNQMKDETRFTLMLNRNNNNNMGAADLGAARFGGMRMRRGGSGGGVTTSSTLMANMNKEFSSTLNLNGDFRIMGNDRITDNKSESVTNRSGNSRQKDYTSSQNNYISNSFAANFTLEWKPDTMNTLTFRPSFGYNNSHSNENGTSSRYKLLDNDVLGDAIFNSSNNAYSKGHGYDVSANLVYAHRFSKRGRVLSVNLQGGYNESTSMEISTTLYEKPTPLYQNLNQHIANDNSSSNFRGSVSYVEPLWKNTFLQASYQVSNNDTKSINSTYDISSVTTASRVDTLSRSTVRNSLSQRAGLSLKFVRPKYNYTIGFNYDPQQSVNKTLQPSERLDNIPYTEGDRLPNIIGDSLFSRIPQSTKNFSPTIDAVYNFAQRSNLRINYDGQTTQPSARQLQDYIDKSNPTSWTQGNPNLKSGYVNNLRVRFQKYVPATQLMYNFEFGGQFSLNDIASTTIWQGDTIRINTYDNINGNWNVNFGGMFNTPLRNKKFSIGNYVNLRANNQNSFISDITGVLKNTMKTYSINDQANINYRSDLFDVGLNLSTGYTHIASTIRKTDNQETLNLGIGANTAWYLPHNWTIESDINYTKRSGTFTNYNIPETMWNAAVTKQLFNKRYGTGSLKLQIYDILQNRSSISAYTTTNGYSISQINVIPSYFICSFIYKFSAFPKGSSATESVISGQERWRDGGGRPDGGGGGRPDGGGGGGGGRPGGGPPPF